MKIPFSKIISILLVALLIAPVVRAMVRAGTVTITSLESSDFPMIYANVTVEDGNGNAVLDLTQNDFAVTENGVDQTTSQYFEVIAPAQNQSGSSMRLADVIFIMDDSGSLRDEQTALRQNIPLFIQNMQEKGVDVNLGLIRYGHYILNGRAYKHMDPEIQKFAGDKQFTKSVDEFNDVLDTFQVRGAIEPAYDAIGLAANSYAFREGAQKVIVLITDEKSNGDKNYDLETITQLLQDKTITLYPMSKPTFGDFTQLAQNTNGAIYNIKGSFDGILTNVINNMSNQYLIRYKSSDPALNGVERLVKIEALGGAAEMSYRPGAQPQIALTTDRTSAIFITDPANPQPQLAQDSYLPPDPILLKVKVDDAAEPFVQNVTMNVRTKGAEKYTQVAMTRASGDDQSGVYTASVPQELRQQPGVEIYFTASDGASVVNYPSADAPFVIVIGTNQPPKITHTKPADEAVQIGQALQFSAHIFDDTNRVQSAQIFYRPIGDLVWQSQDLQNYSGDNYQVLIEKEDITPRGIEYYLQVADDYGIITRTGDSQNPLQVIPPSQITDLEAISCGGLVDIFWSDPLQKSIAKIILTNSDGGQFMTLFPVSDGVFAKYNANFLDTKNLSELKIYAIYRDGDKSDISNLATVTEDCARSQAVKNFSHDFGYFAE